MHRTQHLEEVLKEICGSLDQMIISLRDDLSVDQDKKGIKDVLQLLENASEAISSPISSFRTNSFSHGVFDLSLSTQEVTEEWIRKVDLFSSAFNCLRTNFLKEKQKGLGLMEKMLREETAFKEELKHLEREVLGERKRKQQLKQLLEREEL